MEYRPLGPGALSVSVIGMGTWQTFDIPLSNAAEMATRRAIVDQALAAGVNLFDSSPMYGTAESVLAAALGDRRRDVVIATKVWSSSIERGRAQIERALQLYGNLVDLYQVHNLVGWRDYLPILRDLKSRGHVRAIGITHYAHSAFPELRSIMETQEIDAIQIAYNAADRLAERDLLPLAAELGLGVLVMTPLGAGRLVRHSPPRYELSRFERFGVTSWAQVLLKWIVSEPRVTSTIPATSRPERMRENALAGAPPFFGEEERDRISWLASRYAV